MNDPPPNEPCLPHPNLKLYSWITISNGVAVTSLLQDADDRCIEQVALGGPEVMVVAVVHGFGDQHEIEKGWGWRSVLPWPERDTFHKEF